MSSGASGGAARQAEPEILLANAAFYRAFNGGDADAMCALWAERAPIACFHPGSPALLGRDAVLGSWREILRGPPPFQLRCDRPAVQVLGDVAIVTCYEGNGSRPAHLAATNVWVFEGGRWLMVHHQAGPLSGPLPKVRSPSTLN
jgi:ketosteroid isomerase-like protein